MARINPDLLQRLISKLGVGRSQVYALINAKVSETHLPPNLAAIALAADRGVGITRYASEEDLASIRTASRNREQAAPATPAAVRTPKPRRAARGRGSGRNSPPADSVFVVHGRDTRVRDELYSLLRALGLRPLEWSQAMRLTRTGSPYIGEVLDAAFDRVSAVVVLLTPDDEARLRANLRKAGDPAYESELTGQARANVLFEAGMAFGRKARNTVLVQVGEIRPFSDVGGRHAVHLDGSAQSRQDLATKLTAAGCSIDRSGTHWLSVGEFGQSARLGGEGVGRARRRRTARRRGAR